MSGMSDDLRHGGFGWAYPLTAPEQEFDVVNAFRDVLAIRAFLDRLHEGDLTRENYEEMYQAALRAAQERSSLARPHSAPGRPGDEAGTSIWPTPRTDRANRPAEEPEPDVAAEGGSIADATDSLLEFGARAGGAAQYAVAGRTVLAFVCPDAIGVVAAVTRLLAAVGANVEQSFMTIVGGHTITAFLIATARGLPVSPLSHKLGDVLEDFQGPAPQVTAVAPAKERQARPSWTVHRLVARYAGDESLAATVTQEIAKLAYPLLMLAARAPDSSPALGGTAQALEAHVAAPSGLPAKVELDRMGVLKQSIQMCLPEAHLTVGRSPGKDHPMPEGPDAEPGDHLLLVSGRAGPGFTHSILQALSGLGGAADVRSVSTVVLDDVCVLTALLSARIVNAARGRLRSVEEQIIHAVPLRFPRPHVLLRKVSDSSLVDAHRWLTIPTHELRLEIPEEAGIIAALTEQLEAYESNVVWLSSRLLKPRFGEPARRCVVEMHVSVPFAEVTQLDGSLRSVAAGRGWEGVVLLPWSVSTEAPATDMRNVVEVVDQKIEAELRPPPLVPFHGYVGVDITHEGEPIADPGTVDAVRITAGEGYGIRVRVARQRSRARFERLMSITGDPSDEPVPFAIALESDTIEFDRRVHQITIGPDDLTASVEASFDIPRVGSEHRLSVQVRQRNRTIQIVAVELQVSRAR
jgi:hypothetical protein